MLYYIVVGFECNDWMMWVINYNLNILMCKEREWIVLENVIVDL